MAELTDKQKRFVQEYMKDSCASRAAVRAGYSERAASEIGYQLLQKTSVLEAIQSLQDEIQQQLRVGFFLDAMTARKVLRDILDNPKSTDRDKIAAAKDLLDRAGFKPAEKRELSGSGNPVEIMFVDPS
jgi:phage terminase small subunit